MRNNEWYLIIYIYNCVMGFSIAAIFFIIVIFQLLLISIFLFTHDKGSRLSNGLLGAFFLSICLNLSDSFLVLQKVHEYNPNLIGWGSCIPLLFGPLLFLYTQSVLYKNFSFRLDRWKHFIPFVFCFVVTEAAYLWQTHEVKMTILNGIIERKIPVSVYYVSGFIFLHFFIYIGYSLSLIKRYRTIAGNNFSDARRANISWLSSTIVFFTVCMVIAVLNSFVGLTALGKYYYFFLTVIVLSMFVFINRVLLKALRHPGLFSLIEEKEIAVNDPSTQLVVTKYSGSGLTANEKTAIADRLKQFMEKERPFLEPELTLEQLAVMLSLKPKILSQVINEVLQQNFFEFVNRYRIEAAMRMLTKPADKKITVLEVLYEVGFNSKSSFNTLFKKHTGLTPSEFRKKQEAA